MKNGGERLCVQLMRLPVWIGLRHQERTVPQGRPGATILAAASALPEISTGIAVVRLCDHQLVMSDVFGCNAFQLCLFVLADIMVLSLQIDADGALRSPKRTSPGKSVNVRLV